MAVEIVEKEYLTRLQRRARVWFGGWVVAFSSAAVAGWFYSELRATQAAFSKVQDVTKEQALVNAAFEKAWRNLQETANTTAALGQATKGLIDSRLPPRRN